MVTPDYITHSLRGLPFSTYAPRGGGGGGHVSYTFPLRITCKKGGGEGVQIACKIAYVLNGRPLPEISHLYMKTPT